MRQSRSDVVRADVAQSAPNTVQTTMQGAKKRHEYSFMYIIPFINPLDILLLRVTKQYHYATRRYMTFHKLKRLFVGSDMGAAKQHAKRLAPHKDMVIFCQVGTVWYVIILVSSIGL